MKRISYAPMGEDIVLWRALGSRNDGFFVDVGAHHPVGSSVTKLFSEAGWRGINIEPIAPLLELFIEDRPRDVNLAVGISDVPGELEFFDVIGDQQRSTFDSGLARHYRDEGREVVSSMIPVVSLDSILEEHAPPEIDFLKIDAEGHEASVVASIDLRRWRPRVIVAELGLNAADWPDVVESYGYRRALFDGVNQFFVAEECWDELSAALSYPACPLDEYDAFDALIVMHQRDEALAKLAKARRTIARLRREARAPSPARRTIRRLRKLGSAPRQWVSARRLRDQAQG